MTQVELSQPWDRLLSSQRVAREKRDELRHPLRSVFERDYDRIIFSSAFRRLQDKTQVFPLSSNDFTRTRLTHSLEVASVGRGLGQRAEGMLRDRGTIQGAEQAGIGMIVAAAALAHDIGNPPFGHSGEDAIRHWAEDNLGEKGSDARFPILSELELADLQEWEGNAQGVRILCRLQVRLRPGGLQLTHGTIGAMLKYPCGVRVDGQARDGGRVEEKKFGYFQDDAELIVPVMEALELPSRGGGAFSRHPLALLTEAADDICYAVVDLEDSMDQGLVSRDQAKDVLRPLVEAAGGSEYRGEKEWLRSYAFRGLMDSCMRVFDDNLEAIEQGTFSSSLVDQCELRGAYTAVQAVVRNSAYCDTRVLQVEAAGFRVIGGLLELFVPALLSEAPQKDEAKIRALFPLSYLRRGGGPSSDSHEDAVKLLSPYQRVLAAADYVAGMTDSFAVDLYQKLTGIRLPT